MLTRKVKNRLLSIFVFIFFLIFLVYFILSSLNKNILYFKTPSEVFSSVDVIEKNILRIALYEHKKKELDSSIVINEAIRMSKKYGSVEGYKLVNAVLDKAIKAQ